MKELEFYKCHFCKKDSRKHRIGNIYRLNLSFGNGYSSIYEDKLICTECLRKLSKSKGENNDK